MRSGVERTMEREQAKRARPGLNAQLSNRTGPLDQEIGMNVGYRNGLSDQKQHRRPYGQPPDAMACQRFTPCPIGALQ
jgi:hypothetical protein